jgi:hypothetical protein
MSRSASRSVRRVCGFRAKLDRLVLLHHQRPAFYRGEPSFKVALPPMPAVVARKLMASRSQQSSAKATRTFSPLSQPTSLGVAREMRRSRTEWVKRAAQRRDTWRNTSGREAVPRTPILPQYLIRELERLMEPNDLLVSDASLLDRLDSELVSYQTSGSRVPFPPRFCHARIRPAGRDWCLARRQ